MNRRSERPGKEQGLSEVPSFLRPHTGTFLIIALAFGGLLLSYEHRVHIFASDWILWLPLLICVGMHFFMHGGHGGHGGHGAGDDKS